ncbi:MAG: 3-deoxy-7-phosphoheptulonate synthase [Eubacteriales bacterium]|nr:3-deoxy-7-phosphoheptulonate synthase [Eubacteriales bacterium]
MIVVLKENTTKEQKGQLINWLKGQGLQVHESDGEYKTILGLVGDTTKVDKDMLEILEMVDHVTPISEPYKNANRKFHPKDSVIGAGDVKFGGGNFQVIAGPAAVESEEQLLNTARRVKAAGATVLRGSVFGVRKSPYAFQGLKDEGMKYLEEAKRETGLLLMTELQNIDDLKYYDNVDFIQVGARNMQNYDLLKELGHINKPVLLKRGLASTMEELLMSAEYIMAGGNEQVILCERGIRTFEEYTTDTLDISAVPALHLRTHLPVVVDPSNAAGHADMVTPLAMAATAAGADGLMIEVHEEPHKALKDGAQSLDPDEFDRLMDKVRKIREVLD